MKKISSKPDFNIKTGLGNRPSRLAIILCLAASLAGCGSFFSGAGPTKQSINSQSNSDSAPYTLINLSADTIAPYMRPATPKPTLDVSDTPVPEIRLVPGDVIRVMISDSSIEGALFAPLASGGTVFEQVRIDSKGMISLPYVGRQRVSGLSLGQVETKLRDSINKVASDPQVHVEIVGDLSGSVLVAGAVKEPGRYSALQGALTLLDAINQAGGAVLEPHLVKVVLRTGKEVETYSYQDLLAGANRPIPPRSEVIVERARKRFVAMGAVSEPGLKDLPSDNPSLLEILGTVGGLNERTADARGVFVFRLEESPEGEPRAKVFRLDMREPTAIFLARQFLMEPEDAVYVTNATAYEFQKLISPIVQVLILGNAIDRL